MLALPGRLAILATLTSNYLTAKAEKNKAGFFSFFVVYTATYSRAKLTAGRTFAPRK
jgi:hypothetical protein